MANQDHFDVLKQGVEIWNRWRAEHPEIRADLNSISISNVDLSSINFSNTDLGGANLSGINLSGANFSGSSLIGIYLLEVNLSGANLSNVNLSFANLSGANLLGAKLYADLSGANLTGVNFDKTDFGGSVLDGTVFAENDLTTVQGLETVDHFGPSTINVNNVILPRDPLIYKRFLRGVGFSDIFIDYLPSLHQNVIQYHSVFISYSSTDEHFARSLHADLQNKGVRCWFAPEDMKIGDKIRSRIDKAIHWQDKLLLLLSEHAIASAWVEDEVEAAMEKENQQQREVLFPVRLDDAVMQTAHAWAAKLRRSTNIGDFTNWTDPQAYQTAFDRLLRDLKQN